MIAHVPLRATDAELLQISAKNPGWKIERDTHGALVMTPPTGGESSRRNARLTRLLDEWAEAHGFVAFDSSGGFRLPDTSVVSPDGALVASAIWESMSSDHRKKIPPLVPTVAIEICSETDNPAHLRAKLQRMRKAGADYVALIDPYRSEIWEDGARPADFNVDLTAVLD